MAQVRATGPYIWVTWLPRLLSGESSCEWAAWFKAQHEGSSWARVPSDFDQAGWLMDHTALLNEQREVWEKQGCSVLTEAQPPPRHPGDDLHVRPAESPGAVQGADPQRAGRLPRPCG